MYKICPALLLSVLLLSGPSAVSQITDGPLDRAAVFSVRQLVSRASIPADVRAVDQGPDSEPALPDSTANPAPVAVADRPGDGLLRRRKLRLNMRG